MCLTKTCFLWSTEAGARLLDNICTAMATCSKVLYQCCTQTTPQCAFDLAVCFWWWGWECKEETGAAGTRYSATWPVARTECSLNLSLERDDPFEVCREPTLTPVLFAPSQFYTLLLSPILVTTWNLLRLLRELRLMSVLPLFTEKTHFPCLLCLHGINICVCMRACLCVYGCGWRQHSGLKVAACQD